MHDNKIIPRFHKEKNLKDSEGKNSSEDVLNQLLLAYYFQRKGENYIYVICVKGNWKDKESN